MLPLKIQQENVIMKVFMYVLQLVAHISTDNRTLNILKNRDMMNLDISKMNDYITGNIAGTNKDNWVYINIWDYKPSWTIKEQCLRSRRLLLHLHLP